MRFLQTAITVCMVSKIVLSDCLKASDYSALNLTALSAIQTVSFGSVCPSAFKNGQCVTQDSIIQLFEATKQVITNSTLQKLGRIAGAVQNAGQKFKQAVDNAAKYKNGTWTPPANNSTNATNNSSNGTGNATAPAKKAPKVDKTQLKLDNQVLKRMQDLQNKLNDQKNFLIPITSKDERTKCFRAQFKLLKATICAVSSGNATNYIQRDANGAISAILINYNSTLDVISNCGMMLVKNCDMIDLQQTVYESLGAAANGTAPATPSYCSDMTVLNNCINNTATCPDDLKKSIFSAGFAPLNNMLFNNVNTDSIVSNTNTFAESLDVNTTTTTTTRRLQTTAANIAYTVTTNGINSTSLGSDSTLSETSVENTSTVPDTLNNSAAIQALVMFFGTLVLSMLV